MAESQILNEEAISREKIAQIYGPLKEKVNASIKQQEDVMADVQVFVILSVQSLFRLGMTNLSVRRVELTRVLNVKGLLNFWLPVSMHLMN